MSLIVVYLEPLAEGCTAPRIKIVKNLQVQQETKETSQTSLHQCKNKNKTKRSLE